MALPRLGDEMMVTTMTMTNDDNDEQTGQISLVYFRLNFVLPASSHDVFQQRRFINLPEIMHYSPVILNRFQELEEEESGSLIFREKSGKKKKKRIDGELYAYLIEAKNHRNVKW